MTRLRFIAAVSGIYDASVGVLMLAGRPLLSRLFDVPLPQPPIHADLNGLFLLAVAIGYIIPYRDPDRGRGYLWVMGPFLKGAGAALFLLDHALRHSPDSFLLFAASDGTLALATLWALLTAPRRAE
ncbi:MAG: hypothetical protein ACM3SQ_17490 [Betaproteobacteria bacterium]